MKIDTGNPTRTAQCKGFSILNEIITSDTKACRLSKVDESVTPYPYVIEIFVKNPKDKVWVYKEGDAYETLEEAESNMQMIL